MLNDIGKFPYTNSRCQGSSLHLCPHVCKMCEDYEGMVARSLYSCSVCAACPVCTAKLLFSLAYWRSRRPVRLQSFLHNHVLYWWHAGWWPKLWARASNIPDYEMHSLILLRNADFGIGSNPCLPPAGQNFVQAWHTTTLMVHSGESCTLKYLLALFKVRNVTLSCWNLMGRLLAFVVGSGKDNGHHSNAWVLSHHVMGIMKHIGVW